MPIVDVDHMSPWTIIDRWSVSGRRLSTKRKIVEGKDGGCCTVSSAGADGYRFSRRLSGLFVGRVTAARLRRNSGGSLKSASRSSCRT